MREPISRALVCCMVLLLAAAPAAAEDEAAEGDKLLSGMSIVGNDEAPKSLVIVPWKSSGLGATLDVLGDLDDGPGPVDRDVFRRELDYYELRVGSGGVPGPARE